MDEGTHAHVRRHNTNTRMLAHAHGWICPNPHTRLKPQEPLVTLRHFQWFSSPPFCVIFCVRLMAPMPLRMRIPGGDTRLMLIVFFVEWACFPMAKRVLAPVSTFDPQQSVGAHTTWTIPAQIAEGQFSHKSSPRCVNLPFAIIDDRKKQKPRVKGNEPRTVSWEQRGLGPMKVATVLTVVVGHA